MAINHFNTLPRFIQNKILTDALMEGADPANVFTVCKSWNQLFKDKTMVPFWNQVEPEFIFSLQNSSCKKIVKLNKTPTLSDIKKINDSELSSELSSGLFFKIAMDEICIPGEFKKSQKILSDSVVIDLWCKLIYDLKFSEILHHVVWSEQEVINDFLERMNNEFSSSKEIHKLIINIAKILKPTHSFVDQEEPQPMNSNEEKELRIKYEFALNEAACTIRNWMQDPKNADELNQKKELEFKSMYFPKELWDLKQLETLDLKKIHLFSLPKEIEKLTALKTLDLYKNNFKKFPSELNSLPNLTKLDIAQNKFQEFPIEILDLKQLKELSFCGNPIAIIPQEVKEAFPEAVNEHCNTVLFRAISYNAVSPLAKFYQETLKTESKKKLFNSFSQLNFIDRMCIYGKIGKIYFSDCSITLGKEKVAKDVLCFNQGTKRVISNNFEMLKKQTGYNFCFNQIPLESINQIYGKIYEFSGKPETEDFYWGETHSNDNLAILADAISFYEIKFTSPLAQLCLLFENELTMSIEETKEAFQFVPEADKNRIYGIFWKLSGSPLNDDHQWGEHHLFDDLKLFEESIKSRIKEKMEDSYIQTLSVKISELLQRPIYPFMMDAQNLSLIAEALFLLETEEQITN